MSIAEKKTPLLQLLLAACIALTIGLGIAKTFYLREHPPQYALKEGNNYDGFVSNDNFSRRAALFRAWMIGDEGAGQELLTFLQEDLHPNSLSIPILVGATAVLTKSIPLTFMALSALAVVGQTLLVVYLAKQASAHCGHSSESSSRAALIGGILFASHVLTVRTSAQLTLDPFCSLLALGCLALALHWSETRRCGPSLFLVQVVGLFTKVSYLPLLAVPALVVVVREKNYRLAVRAGVLFALLPLLPVALYLSVVPGASSASRDFEHFINAWRLSLSELQHFSIEMVLLFQFWPVLMYLAWQRRDGMTRAILLSAGVVVLSTWAFKLPAVPRLYLPSLAMAVAGSGPAIVATIQRPITIPLVALVALANYSLMIVGTFF